MQIRALGILFLMFMQSSILFLLLENTWVPRRPQWRAQGGFSVNNSQRNELSLLKYRIVIYDRFGNDIEDNDLPHRSYCDAGLSQEPCFLAPAFGVIPHRHTMLLLRGRAKNGVSGNNVINPHCI